MTFTIETNPLHPTTACCAEALGWLHEGHSFKNILDIGCGNGVLSLVAAGLWKSRVLATDISEQAVQDTTQSSKAHALDTYITAIRSDGFSHSLIREHAPYDLIICNLLAEPIVRMLPDMEAHTAKDSVCILSGIRSWEIDNVENAYKQRGFALIHQIVRSPWHALLLKR